MLVHLMSGTRGLLIAYAIVLLSMLITLYRIRAPWTKFLQVPFFAIVMVIAAALCSALLGGLPFIGTRPTLQNLIGLALSIFAGCIGAYGLIKARSPSEPIHRRGAFVTARPLKSRTGTPAIAGGVTLAGMPIPLKDETKHFKLIGTTGTGKSTAIREILAGALARGDRLVIADPDGGYLNRFYDAARGDVILNPFDGEARKWDLFGEIVHDYDIDQLARSLIPDAGDQDRIWCEYARTFLTALVRQCIREGVRDDRELFRLVKGASIDEVRTLLAGTAAGPFLELGNEKMFGSIRSVASSAVGVLEYTTRQNAPPLSVREWIRQGGGRAAGGAGGVLFFPYKAGEIAALRSVISAWMRLAIFEAMDRPEGDQFLWFVIDELDALGEIDGLKDALARLRKFGGRCILGLQSIAQVSRSYGRGIADTIVENCGNTVILRCSASEHGGTSEFASKLIGQREVMHTTESVTRMSGQWRSSTSTTEHLKIEPAVMASEIERLPDLAGFLKIASHADWHRVELTPDGPAPAPRRRPPVVVVDRTGPQAPLASASPPASAPIGSARSGSKMRRASAVKFAAKRRSKAGPAAAPSADEGGSRKQPDASANPKPGSRRTAVRPSDPGAESPP